MKKLHFFSNPFVLQSLVSTVPSVIVNGFIPVFGIYLGLSLTEIGLLFMSMRASMVLGSQKSPWLLSKQKPHTICFAVESFNIAVTLLMCTAIWANQTLLFSALCCIRAINLGIVTTVRFYWLKQLVQSSESNRINIFINSAYQVSYGLVGISILISPSVELGLSILFFDAITSLVGAILFFRLKKLFVGKASSPNKNSVGIKVLFSTFSRRKVFVMELFIVLAMAGSNIILVKYGELFWKNYGGYGTSLVVYGFCYLIGSLIFRSLFLENNNKYFYLTFSLLMAVAFSLISIESPPTFSVLIFTLIFLAYPAISLKIEKWWFILSNQSDAAQISASRNLLNQSIFALGEVTYAIVHFDSFIRSGFLFIASILILVLPKEIKR